MQIEEIDSNPTGNLDSGFFKRAHLKNSCGEIINLALSIPGINVLAVGPEACLRVLYFRASRENLLDRLTMLTTSRIDSTMGLQTKLVESALEQIIAEEKDSVKAIIVYVSCIELLMASDFGPVLKSIELKYNIPVRLFKRGPLSKRRLLPKERLSIIFSEILDFYSEQDFKEQKTQPNCVNILGEVLLSPDSELKRLLVHEGIYSFNDFLGCIAFEQFSNLKKANFSVITHKFGINLAKYLEKTYNIPYCFVPSRYGLVDIAANYKSLSETLGINLDYEKDKKIFEIKLANISHMQFKKNMAVGIGDNTLDLSKALLEWGFKVKIILLDTITKQDMKRIDEIKQFSEEIQIIPVPSITMRDKQETFKHIELSIGDLAANYCVNAKKIFIDERYDFGFKNASRVLSGLYE